MSALHVAAQSPHVRTDACGLQVSWVQPRQMQQIAWTRAGMITVSRISPAATDHRPAVCQHRTLRLATIILPAVDGWRVRNDYGARQTHAAEKVRIYFVAGFVSPPPPHHPTQKKGG